MYTYIITPTWNCGDEFVRYMHSLAEFTHEPVKMIVVENGSLPDERRIVEDELGRKHGHVEIVDCLWNDVNLGIPVAQNLALRYLALNTMDDPDRETYEVILMDADTEVVSHDWLGRLRQGFVDHPKAGIVGGAKSPLGMSLPVFYNDTMRWYQHQEYGGIDAQGEGLDFSCVFLRWELLAAPLRFDEGYDLYDGHDEDLCFRVRSWGYECWQVNAGVWHHGSAAMKKANYQWRDGGKPEWEALRQRNRTRMVSIWHDFMAPLRPTVEAEESHLERMNAKLVAEARDRKVPPTTMYRRTRSGFTDRSL